MALEGCRSLHLFMYLMFTTIFFITCLEMLIEKQEKHVLSCYNSADVCTLQMHIAKSNFSHILEMTHTWLVVIQWQNQAHPPPPPHLFKYIFQQSSCSGAGIWRNSCLCARPSNSADLLYSLTFQSMGGKWGLYHEKKTTQELHRY